MESAPRAYRLKASNAAPSISTSDGTSPAADVTAYTKKKGRLRCHKRPKSREETLKEGSDSGAGLGDRYRIPLAKTIAISGSKERKGSRTDTKVYGARP